MNLAQHQLYLYSPTGELLTIIPDGGFVSLDYGFRENEPGVLEVTLPGDFRRDYLRIDGEIEVYRAYGIGGYQLEGNTAFFIRRIVFQTGEDGTRFIQVTAYSATDILKRRIVAYYAGSSYSEKLNLPWDNMMREIVDENYGPGASYSGASYGDPLNRDLTPWLVIEPDLNFGASYPIDRSFAWEIVLNVLKGITDDVKSQGIYCSFDLVRVSPAHFEFRVFLGPRGVDHSEDSASPVVVSEEAHNLVIPVLDDDWQVEHNFIYAAGQGQEDDRIIRTAEDTARLWLSPFNRQEYQRDARNSKLPDTVQAEASSALEEGRPRNVFSGKIAQTEGCLYGVHWGWGDIVTASYQGRSFDCHVDSVTISIDAIGTEHVEGNLRSLDDAQQ